MKALTIRQPWAHAIIRDGKDVENRTWAPPIAAMPFRMAVHAGKGYDGPGAYRGEPDRDALVFGAVIGDVIVAATHHADQCRCECSKWAQPGQWHWMLVDPVAHDEPVPVKGMLGLWEFEAGGSDD